MIRKTKLTVTWEREITLPDGAEIAVEYDVLALCTPGYAPVIGTDPDNSDPGDPGDITYLKVWHAGKLLELAKFVGGLTPAEDAALQNYIAEHLE